LEREEISEISSVLDDIYKFARFSKKELELLRIYRNLEEPLFVYKTKNYENRFVEFFYQNLEKPSNKIVIFFAEQFSSQRKSLFQ
jgi:hypothetical protein